MMAVSKAESAGHEVFVHYRPYMIDPRTNRDGEDYKAYNRRRWGSDGWTHSLRERGKQLGLGFSSWRIWPNTFNAHRLCYFLAKKDAESGAALDESTKVKRALDLVNKFYELTYERGENISTPAGAAQAIEELGFGSAAEAEAWLRQGGGEDEVIEADTYAKKEKDISGVPFFVISGEDPQRRPVELSGAQGTSAFVKAFQHLGVSA
eukprot:TRINITY_DN62109_c0_g1_i1.p1 TRINITY_DN62109_c0_g1~~TRINITY_DN62109_c0_g1_i1.p1  ORF type:complete len:207 (-),score=47.85 TRINITY_DN62109_c0_g1_i1:30-650(-)